MQVRYKGGRYGTTYCELNGFPFHAGVIVELDDIVVPPGKQQKYRDMCKIVANHSFFEKITPELLRKEAREAAEAARVAAEKAAALAAEATVDAEALPHEVSLTEREDVDGSDEGAVAEPSPPKPRSARRRRDG